MLQALLHQRALIRAYLGEGCPRLAPGVRELDRRAPIQEEKLLAIVRADADNTVPLLIGFLITTAEAPRRDEVLELDDLSRNHHLVLAVGQVEGHLRLCGRRPEEQRHVRGPAPRDIRRVDSHGRRAWASWAHDIKHVHLVQCVLREGHGQTNEGRTP
eukprot:CAMPEP_0204012094 /NCGR_PEP_ID=MMETSP0360-20130528/23766_1 /ASSEMBLY_ACC=CAM_ASM_000342 /TAXON_ID=268821 /ORGANISM="Scrippsiella Hangoei, Strain SHTV-5" /LENGTH=157 /DNA_ID=CAMNT_0050954749 /DNA_START=1 /DNA_END=471 /DNA_ORIENTATION=-